MQLSKIRAIDFRVNTCLTLYGEKIVLRILDPTSAQLGIEALGFEEEQSKDFCNYSAKKLEKVFDKVFLYFFRFQRRLPT